MRNFSLLIQSISLVTVHRYHVLTMDKECPTVLVTLLTCFYWMLGSDLLQYWFTVFAFKLALFPVNFFGSHFMWEFTIKCNLVKLDKKKIIWWLIYSKQESKYTNNTSKSIICIMLGTRNIFFIKKKLCHTYYICHNKRHLI